MDYTQIRIDAHRLKADFDALATIGATAEGGVDRPAMSEAHLEARRWFRRRALDAGLEFRVDSAGNHAARLLCAPPGAPTLLLGSHLDSVPAGGRFDGALGVLAALETLRVVRENRLALPFNLEAIDFTDEEGTLVGLLGSSALAGRLSRAVLEQPRGGRQALQAALARAGLTEEGLLQASRAPEELAGYLELHVEQGARLERLGAQIGVVSAIVGIASFRLVYLGRADHAGTTPAAERKDAAQGAAAFTLETRRAILERFPSCAANVGWMRFEPGAFNVVPARVELGLELRAAEEGEFQALEGALLECAREEAERFGLGFECEPLGRHAPTSMSPAAQGAIRRAAEVLDLKSVSMTSGAGHDAQSLAHLCPAGMIFVPSAGGASHCGREFTEWQDCLNGANALLQAALAFAFPDE